MPQDSDSTRLRGVDPDVREFRERNNIAEKLDEPAPGRGSTRLADFHRTRFEIREGLQDFHRERIQQTRSRFATALDLADDRIQSIQLDDRGEQIGFAPDERGRGVLEQRFADARRFVEPGDVLVDADPREGVTTRTDPDATDRIESRAQQDFAAEDSFAEPGDFGVDVGAGGVEDARLTDSGAQRRAGRQFESETPLMEVDPTADVQAVDDGFGLTSSAQRRLSARQFEQQFDQFGTGALDPMNDVREVDGAFGLAEGAARTVAADQIDGQIPEVDIGPSDLDVTERGGGGFEFSFEADVQR